MCMEMKKSILIALLFCWVGMSAQTTHEVRDSVKIYFRQGKTDLDPALGGNQSALDRIADSLRTSYADSVYLLQKIIVDGGASPEGSVKLNKQLSERRAEVLFDYLSQYGELPDSLKTTEFLGCDWNGLISLVEKDQKVPYREETLALLRNIAGEARRGFTSDGEPLARIKRLRGGEPYAYMYRNLFPELRASRLYLWYRKDWNPVIPKPEPKPDPEPEPEPEVVMPPVKTVATVEPDTTYIPQPDPQKPFYMDLRTNMLYDALLLPSIGVEICLGKDWSVMANWTYGWWSRNRSHRYWRAYGGDLGVRKWFGSAAKQKPLTGHHLGVYGQIFTYDFENGGRGYMGGKPGATLWDKMNYAFGFEYGYSLPIASRLNIDFSIGIGYWGGIYHEYLPIDDCYVWQKTSHRHWLGPTKAEVSLVWLLGRDNRNMKKGGAR